MASNVYFRAGVGVVVTGRDGRVLALERRDVPGSWQLPQGGLEQHEEPLDAARRELEEETGIVWGSVELLDEHPSWMGYELPPRARSAKTGRGQVHRWFLVRFVGDDDDIDLRTDEAGGEFADWTWMVMRDLAAATWDVRRPVYRALASQWSVFLA